MNVNMPLLRIIYCLMEVHFLSLGSKRRRPWEICPCDGTRFCNRSLRQELYQFQRFHHEYPIPLEASWSLLSYATTRTSIEAVCRELCLFWWRLFQSHVVQTGPIWLPTSRWILYHSIRFYPMYYTWMESLSSLLSYATNGTSIEVVWRELCPFSWRLFGNNVVRTGPIWAR